MNINTLDITEAANFLKIANSTAYELAEKGILPGGKIGKHWVFIETELAQYLSDEISRQQRERAELADIKNNTPVQAAPKKATQTKDNKKLNPSIKDLPQIPKQAA